MCEIEGEGEGKGEDECECEVEGEGEPSRTSPAGALGPRSRRCLASVAAPLAVGRSGAEHLSEGVDEVGVKVRVSGKPPSLGALGRGARVVALGLAASRALVDDARSGGGALRRRDGLTGGESMPAVANLGEVRGER